MSLATNISSLATAVATEVKKNRGWINGNAADLGALDTTAKSNLVAAINEVNTIAESAAGGGVAIDDDTPGLTTTYSSSKIETVATAAADAAKTAILGGAGAAFDTLSELNDLLGDNEDAVTALTTTVGGKAPINNPTFTGTASAPTPTGGDSTTKIATTAFVGSAITAAATPAASATVAGKVELATDAEVQTGTDTSRAVTPAGLASEIGDWETTTFAATFAAGLS